MMHTYHCTFMVLGTDKFVKRDIKARNFFDMKEIYLEKMPGNWFLYSWLRAKRRLRNKKRCRL